MNVPKIRFKEFNDEYKKVKFGDIVNYQKGFAFKSKDYKNSGVRIIRISDTTNNSIKNDNAIYINKEEAVKHKNVELITDDIMISSVGSKPPLYDSMVGKVVLIPEFINGSLLNQNAIRFRTKQDNQKYIYNYLKQRKYTRFIENIMRGNANQRSITLEDLFEFELNIPSLNEQNKVSKLLSLLNKKIELQSKKIEDLKLFKKGLSKYIFNLLTKYKYEKIKLGNACDIVTGKLDANAMVENGKYRFYTCAKEYYMIDKYAYDTEALLISGNGAYVGYIHYYNGKFNAYQRTYILHNFKYNVQYIKCYLDEYLSEKINLEKKDGNTPYIVLSTLSDMIIKIPSPFEQLKISKIGFMSSF